MSGPDLIVLGNPKVKSFSTTSMPAFGALTCPTLEAHASFLHQTCRYLLVVFTPNSPSASIHDSARATSAVPSTRSDEYAHASPLTRHLLLSAYGGDHHLAHSVDAIPDILVHSTSQAALRCVLSMSGRGHCQQGLSLSCLQ